MATPTRERAEHREMLLGDPLPPDTGDRTTYIQIRRYDRKEKKIRSIPGLSITLYDYDHGEVFEVVRAALIAHNERLRHARADQAATPTTEAETNDDREEEGIEPERPAARDGAESERPEDARDDEYGGNG